MGESMFCHRGGLLPDNIPHMRQDLPPDMSDCLAQVGQSVWAGDQIYNSLQPTVEKPLIIILGTNTSSPDFFALGKKKLRALQEPCVKELAMLVLLSQVFDDF